MPFEIASVNWNASRHLNVDWLFGSQWSVTFHDTEERKTILSEHENSSRQRTAYGLATGKSYSLVATENRQKLFGFECEIVAEGIRQWLFGEQQLYFMNHDKEEGTNNTKQNIVKFKLQSQWLLYLIAFGERWLQPYRRTLFARCHCTKPNDRFVWYFLPSIAMCMGIYHHFWPFVGTSAIVTGARLAHRYWLINLIRLHRNHPSDEMKMFATLCSFYFCHLMQHDSRTATVTAKRANYQTNTCCSAADTHTKNTHTAP